MARLPVIGGDEDYWGNVLVEFLQVEHDSDGTLKRLNQANGICPLDSNSLVPSANLGLKGGYSAIVYIDGSSVIARDHKGDLIASGTAGTDDNDIISSALSSLTNGRSWKERVLLKGSFTVADSVIIPAYTSFQINGKITLADGVNKPPIRCDNSDYIDIIGGVVDGNGSNQTSYPTGIRGVININSCSFVNVIYTRILNGYQDGLYVLFDTGDKCVNSLYVVVNSPSSDGIFYDTSNLDLDVESLIVKPCIYSAGDNPIQLSDLQGVLILHPTIESSGSSLSLEDCQDCTILNPQVRNPSGHGIVINSARRGIGKNKVIGGLVTSSTASSERGVYILQSKDNYIFGVTVYNFSECFRIDSAGSATLTVERNFVQSCIADTPGSTAFSTGGSGQDNTFLDCIVKNLGSATAFSLALSGDKAERYRVDGKPSWAEGSATIANGNTSVTVNHGLVSTPTNVQLTGTHSEVKDAYVTNVGSTSFDIKVDSAVTADRTVYWKAKV